MESIHKSKAEKAREKTLSDQLEAKHAKSKASRSARSQCGGGIINYAVTLH